MNMQKVYDKHGKHVDSFRRPSWQDYARGKIRISYNTMIRLLNNNGFYIKGQTTSEGVRV